MVLLPLTFRIELVSSPAPMPSMKYRSPHGPAAWPASNSRWRAVFQERISQVTGRSAMPRVLDMLLAVPIGSTAMGTSRPIMRRATLLTVPSPAATTITSADFFNALCQPFSFEDW
jgi:hypothetical protein